MIVGAGPLSLGLFYRLFKSLEMERKLYVFVIYVRKTSTERPGLPPRLYNQTAFAG